jgi:hypothetical protein
MRRTHRRRRDLQQSFGGMLLRLLRRRRRGCSALWLQEAVAEAFFRNTNGRKVSHGLGWLASSGRKKQSYQHTDKSAAARPWNKLANAASGLTSQPLHLHYIVCLANTLSRGRMTCRWSRSAPPAAATAPCALRQHLRFFIGAAAGANRQKPDKPRARVRRYVLFESFCYIICRKCANNTKMLC